MTLNAKPQESNGEGVKFIVTGVVGITVLGLAYFGIIKPILQTLNVIDTKEEKEGGKAEADLSRKAVMSPVLYAGNKPLISISSGTASQLSSNVYNGKWGGWGGLSDDEPLGVGGVTGAGSKVNISYVGHVFNKTYNKDMHSYLDTYLEAKDWTTIDDYIKNTNKF